MTDYSIWVLEYGYVDQFPASSLLTAQPHQGHRRMPYCFGLLRSAQECVLVDTGYFDEAVHQRLSGRYGTTYWTSPVDMLARVGVTAGDVDAIVLTHNHLDHSGCVGDFPNAHVYLQRRELTRYADALARPRRFEFLLRATDPKLPGVLTERAHNLQVTYVNGYLPVAGGIELRPAFDTHTAGSQFALVDNAADGRWLFAGDNVYTYQNVEGLNGDGVLEPIGTSTGSQSVWLDTIDQALTWVGRETSRVLPFHEAELFRRFASREYPDGLHVAEISLAGGHDSVLSATADQEGMAAEHG
ncbi:MAG: N-acyl homoserine lactonase family protein [Actinobacteria bacterium]|nr:N-acyl homoserine lactonase family protein [Actinomycetota bacterium]